MFNLYGNDRLAEWKRLRDYIETDKFPLQTVVNLWASAPFIPSYLDPLNNNSWPDPWRLILDDKFDDLAICLGMLYTLQLTQRFNHCQYEIHMSIIPKMKDPVFYLSVDRSFVLNYTYKEVVDFDEKLFDNTTLLYTTK